MWLQAVMGGLALAETPPPAHLEGVVVAAEPEEGATALGATRGHEGHWKPLDAGQAPPRSVAEPPIGALRSAYLQADFLRCLAVAQDGELRRDRLLAEGQREAAARAGYLAAACLSAIGEDTRARQVLRAVLVAGLPLPDEAVRPDFKPIARSEQAAVAQVPKLKLKLSTNPAGAELFVDGAALACAERPCEVAVLPGEHVVVARALGRRPTVVPLTVQVDTTATITLDWATANEAAAQVQHALDRHVAATDANLLKAATLAAGVRWALGVHADEGGHAAVVFDGEAGRSVSRGEAKDLVTAANHALTIWEDQRKPTPWWRRPWVIATTAVLVAGGTAAAVLLAGREGTRYDFVFKEARP